MDVGNFLGGGALGGTLGAVAVRVGLDTAAVDKGLAGTQAQLATFEKTQLGAMDRMKAAWSSFAPYVGMAVVAGLALAAKAASDLGEAQNKVNVIFGSSVDIVNEFADSSAEAFGISGAAALDAAGNMGNMFINMGISADEAANMSTEIVGLSGDWASFANQDPNDMLTAMRSGLSGEIEPLKKFGINLSAAAVEAKALKMGLADADGQLSESAKLQARYALILEQSTAASGDFARTLGDSFPNQVRKFKAELTDTAAQIGQVVLPTLTQLMTILGGLFDVIEPIIPLVDDAARAFLVWYTITRLLPAGLNLVSTGFLNMAVSMKALEKPMLGAAGGAAKAGGAISALGGPAMMLLVAGIMEGQALLDSFGTDLEEIAKTSMFTKEQLVGLDTQISGAETDATSWGALIGMIDGTKDQVVGLQEALNPLVVEFDRLGLSASQASKYVLAITERWGAEAGTAGSINDITEALQSNIENIVEWGKQLDSSEIGLTEYKKRVQELGFTHEEATAMANESLDSYGKHLTKNGKIVNNWASMTSDDIKSWYQDTRDSFADMTLVLGGFGEDWKITRQEFHKGVNQMLEDSAILARDMEKLADMELPSGFEKWLIELGPGAIHAFVTDNKRGRDDVVADWKEGAKNVDEAMGGSLKNILGLIQDLDGSKGDFTVNGTIRYKVEGGVNIDQLLEVKG